MARTVERRFLGWDGPALPRAADLLAGELAPGDLVVLPGRRAARRLEELLAARRADDHEPPRLVTESGLAAALCGAPLSVAPRLALELAWARALAELGRREVERLFGAPPAAGDLAAWLGLARAALRSLDPLARAGLDLDGALARTEERLGGAERSRVQALASAAGATARALAEAGWRDPTRLARAALESGALDAVRRVWLLALVDLDGARRALLEAFEGDVIALVVAPEAEADGFDAWGSLDPAPWLARDLPLEDGQWTPVARPLDCAHEACAWLERRAAEAPRAPEEITLGVLDSGLTPFLERGLAARGVRLRPAEGVALEGTLPARALGAAAEWLRGRDFAALAALVRHPRVEAQLDVALEGAAARTLEQLDRYGNEHLPWRLDDGWLGDRREREPLERLERALRDLLGDLAREEPLPLSAWAAAAGVFLGRLWTAVDPSEGPAARSLHEALLGCAEALREARELEGSPLDTKPLRAADALAVLCRALEGRRAALPPDAGALEAVGWLELALDEAPLVFLAGFDEGCVPAPAREDALLPEALREAAGLEAEERRVARDAWLATVILASRERSGLHAVSVRTSHEGDPRRPSRLLFHAPSEVAAARALRAFAPEAAEDREASPEVATPPLAARVLADAPLPESMRVTGFKDYLESPFGFYLKHVLRLERVDDPPPELDPLTFGILAHDVLDAFGGAPEVDATTAEPIFAFLSAELDRLATACYGRRPQPAVRLQVEQLRNRLDGFARWQARTRAAGWRIDAVEFEVEDFALEVDGTPMPVRGRIDRLDRHVESGALRVIDYKTGETGEKPPRAPREAGDWKDLQLPLYHAMVAPRAAGEPVELGYVVIPKERARVEFLPAAYSEGHLLDGLDTAREVVRRVRRREFEELGRFEGRERDPILRALAGVGLVGSDVDLEGDDETVEEEQAS